MLMRLFFRFHLTVFIFTLGSHLSPSPPVRHPSPSSSSSSSSSAQRFPSVSLTLFFMLFPPLQVQQRGAFSISAQLLQINDLIRRNKQVSSTLDRVHFPVPSLTQQQQHALEKEGKEGEGKVGEVGENTQPKQSNQRWRNERPKWEIHVCVCMCVRELVLVFPLHPLPKAVSNCSTMTYSKSVFTNRVTSYDFSHSTGRTNTHTHTHSV